jgi:hypothetical protein
MINAAAFRGDNMKNKFEDLQKDMDTIGDADMCMFPRIKNILVRIPVFLLVPVVYVALGMLTKLWHPLWLLFFLIPIHLWLCFAFRAKSMKSFLLRLPIPLLAVVQFLCSGLFLNLWKYAWLTFLLIPLYYWFVAAFMKKKK